MVKFMVFIVRRPDLSPADFARHFREIHGPLVARLPGLVDYRQNIVQHDDQNSPGFALCDAVAELWFDSRAALDAVWDTAEGLAAIADNPLFLDLERTHYAVVSEHPPR